MRLDLAQVLPLLKRDITTTLAESYDRLVDETAADIQELAIADHGARLVNDVQQYFHDSRIDPTWPTCTLHSVHPLWYRDGAWWCVEDGVAIAPLGELVLPV